MVIRWWVLWLSLGWVAHVQAQTVPAQVAPTGSGEQLTAAANRQRSEFAPPPGPYGRTLGALPGAGYFPPSWGGSATLNPPPSLPAYHLPSQFTPTQQAMPQPQFAPVSQFGATAPQPMGAAQQAPTWARPETRYDAGSAWDYPVTNRFNAYPESAGFNPNTAASPPAWSAQQPAAHATVPGNRASGTTLQWQVPQSSSRQEVIYPGITPVDSYAPQPTAAWPQSGYTTPSGAYSRGDHPVWPTAPEERQYPESQLFPRRTP